MLSLIVVLAVCTASALMVLFGFSSWMKQDVKRALLLTTGGIFLIHLWTVFAVSRALQNILATGAIPQ